MLARRMLAVVSPAKSLDYRSPVPPVAATEPRFAAEAKSLAAAAARLTAPKLRTLMGISDKLARLNVDRFRTFAGADERPAIFAFAGDVYHGFDVKSLDEPGLLYAQDHVRILSGLYGLLRPLDLIRPYRLEMGTRWAPGRPKDLYAWWSDRVSRLLAADVAEDGSGLVVNLASREYWHVVAQAPPAGVRVLAIDFREDGPGGPRFNSFAAKRARGMMARWIAEHRIDTLDGLRGFDSDGYRHVAEESDDASWRFVRG